MQVDVDEIIDLIEREQQLYDSLILLVDEEMKCARDGNMSALMDILRRKQAVICDQEILQDLWLELAALLGVSSSRETVEFWDALALKLDQNGYSQVVESIGKIRERAAKILEKEHEVQRELETRLADLRSDLLRLNDGMRAFRAYMR